MIDILNTVKAIESKPDNTTECNLKPHEKEKLAQLAKGMSLDEQIMLAKVFPTDVLLDTLKVRFSRMENMVLDMSGIVRGVRD